MDPQELGKLVDEHGAALELFARQWCNRPQDVVQEAFVKLMSARRKPDRPVPWLYAVVRNQAISLYRSATRRRRRERERAKGDSGWFVANSQDRIDAKAAAEALKNLPTQQREAVVAHLWGGLTFEEMGQVLECGSSTAHRRYTGGIEALREKLGVVNDE